MSELGSPAPVSTSVLWETVTGARLEELLYGLLDAMGAKELVWRAGSSHGVTASDGGRDLEALFVQPTPDGEEDRNRWWIESKGRKDTVPKDEVTSSVNNLATRNDIDIFVFCTNSRFSNPTRDWIESWQKINPRPKIRLWDRDTLDRLVRKYPTVAARTVPEALNDAQRLELLQDRFWALGETPTESDLSYYWDRKSVIADSPDSVRAVAMFTHAEVDDGLVRRPWGSLIQDDPLSIISTFITAIFSIPQLSMPVLARPIDSKKLTETAAYLLMSVIPYWPAENLYKAIYNFADFVDGDDFPLKKSKAAAGWAEYITTPIIGRIQDELVDVCADDCVRVSSDPRAFSPPMQGKRYWRRFGLGEARDDRILTIEYQKKPCVVGLPLDDEHGCPLLSDPVLTAGRLEELHRVITFRRVCPEGERWKLEPPDPEILASINRSGLQNRRVDTSTEVDSRDPD